MQIIDTEFLVQLSKNKPDVDDEDAVAIVPIYHNLKYQLLQNGPKVLIKTKDLIDEDLTSKKSILYLLLNDFSSGNINMFSNEQYALMKRDYKFDYGFVDDYSLIKKKVKEDSIITVESSSWRKSEFLKTMQSLFPRTDAKNKGFDVNGKGYIRILQKYKSSSTFLTIVDPYIFSSMSSCCTNLKVIITNLCSDNLKQVTIIGHELDIDKKLNKEFSNYEEKCTVIQQNIICNVELPAGLGINIILDKRRNPNSGEPKPIRYHSRELFLDDLRIKAGKGFNVFDKDIGEVTKSYNDQIDFYSLANELNRKVACRVKNEIKDILTGKDNNQDSSFIESILGTT